MLGKPFTNGTCERLTKRRAGTSEEACQVFPGVINGVIRNVGAEIANACRGIMSGSVWPKRILLFSESLIANCV